MRSNYGAQNSIKIINHKQRVRISAILVGVICSLVVASQDLKTKDGRSNSVVGEWWRRAASSLSPTSSQTNDRQQHYHQDYNADSEEESDHYHEPDQYATANIYDQPSPTSSLSKWPKRKNSQLHLRDQNPLDQYYQSNEVFSRSPSERFDYHGGELKGEEDHDYHLKEVEHRHKEVKEVSYVYPVLVALLILGALFVPFISLFFFLSVSAFNCQSGLSQVTPIFGRRRRRRRKRQTADERYASENGTATTLLRELNEHESDYLADRNKSSAVESANLLRTSQLPLVMLFDSAHDMLWSPAQSLASIENKTPTSGLFERNEKFAMFEDDLEELRARLAHSTQMLWDAIVKFGSDLML